MADENGSSSSQPEQAASGVMGFAESVVGSMLPSDQKLNDFLQAGKSFLVHEAESICDFAIAKIASFYHEKLHKNG